MHVFETLKKYRKRRSRRRSLEHIFHMENEYLLTKYPYFDQLLSKDHEFGIVQANIICRALLNKEIIDKVILDYKDECLNLGKQVSSNEIKERVNAAIVDLPYLNDDHNHRIYIPFFSESLNIIYVDEPEKLLTYPYEELLGDFSHNIIDIFEVYNYKLYDSFFSKMIRSVGDKTSNAFFCVDDYCIYVINSQGRLDVIIHLFDRYMRKYNLKEIMVRVNKAMEKYFDFEKSEFVNELYRQRLISFRMYHKLKVGIDK
ncbi:MAG: hypothetical protein J1F31_02455 [Erysipelotrichales bacterium]|nr:hypothetical protein [Erysipelotrichales bacterium]